MYKTKLIFLVTLMVLALSAAGFAAEQCVDSDGDNIYAKGVVSYPESNDIRSTQQDTCFDGKTLYEQTCEGGKKVACEFGCSDGSCRTVGALHETPTSCTDTDADDNMYVKGYIYSGTELAGVREDYCASHDTLYEQNCAGGKFVSCPAGCNDGTCRPTGSLGAQQSECLDSDNGDNFFAKGAVSYTGDIREVYPDYCSDFETLVEQTCEGPIEVFCTRGCSDGTCAETSEAQVVGDLDEGRKVLSAEDVPGAEEPAAEEPATEEPAAEAPAPTPAPQASGANRNKVLMWIVIILVLGAIWYFSTNKKKK